MLGKAERRIEKPESLTTENVFLDTCIFVAEKFNSSAYQTIIHLGTIDAVKLKTTEPSLPEPLRPFACREAVLLDVLRLRAEGKSWRNVAKTLDLPMSTVIDACRSLFGKPSRALAPATAQTQPLTHH